MLWQLWRARECVNGDCVSLRTGTFRAGRCITDVLVHAVAAKEADLRDIGRKCSRLSRDTPHEPVPVVAAFRWHVVHDQGVALGAFACSRPRERRAGACALTGVSGWERTFRSYRWASQRERSRRICGLAEPQDRDGASPSEGCGEDNAEGDNRLAHHRRVGANVPRCEFKQLWPRPRFRRPSILR